MHDKYSFEAKRSCAQSYHLIARFPFALFHQCAKGGTHLLSSIIWVQLKIEYPPNPMAYHHLPDFEMAI
jgi:hypothetical protein